MRATIERSIIHTTVSACKVAFENGAPVATPLDPITVYGNVTEEQATKIVKKQYGANAVFAGMESTEKHYEISVEDFVKSATEVERKSDKAEA